MDLLTLHFARHALAQQAATNPALLSALSATDDEIAWRVVSAPSDTDHGALAAALYGVARSSHWATVERDFLSKNPTCAACGGRDGLNIHHEFDFHEAIDLGRPDLELDERNLITLCTGVQHHVLLGHRDSYQSYNPTVRQDVRAYFGWDEARIRADAAYQELVASRPANWSEWTSTQKVAQRSLLDADLPPDPTVLQRFDLSVSPVTV